MMKTKFFLGLALVSMLFSCITDDTADIIINDSSDNSVTNNTSTGSGTTGQTIKLAGTYTENLTLNPINSYVLNGSLIMASGTTLTIPAGMIIKAEATGANVYIAIAQGAKIIANGTASEPIVLTL